MPDADQLRNLPAVDEILRHEQLGAVVARCPRPQIVGWIRLAVDDCRRAILAGEPFDADTAARFVVERTLQHQAADEGRRQHRVINATGILLHTNLGRAPLADRAVQRMQESSGYANIEMNLQTGKRNQRGERVCQLLRQLTGAEAAAVTNNCAAATMLVLQTMATGREVIVSRGQLVEIGGGYRLPEVFSASGATLKEVGTTNRTYLRDYENAISENTAAIIRVHRSNFYQGGFVTEPDVADLVALGKERNVPVIDDLGSGCIQDLSPYGLSEPTVPASVAAGADVTLFSGDKLFGGPQAGIIVGREDHIAAVRRSPLMRALRIDKMTMAALEATAEIHLAGTAAAELPLLQMLTPDAGEIRDRCQLVCDMLTLPSHVTVEVTECVSQIGGGSAPGSQIASFGLRVTGPVSETLASLLRSESPAVVGRVQDGSLMLDLRTVAATQLTVLGTSLMSALNRPAAHEA